MNFSPFIDLAARGRLAPSSLSSSEQAALDEWVADCADACGADGELAREAGGVGSEHFESVREITVAHLLELVALRNFGASEVAPALEAAAALSETRASALAPS